MFFSFVFVYKCCKACARSEIAGDKFNYQEKLLTDLEAILEQANISLENSEISKGVLKEISKNIISLMLLCHTCDEAQSAVCKVLTMEDVLIDESELEKRAKKTREENKNAKVVGINSKKK